MILYELAKQLKDAGFPLSMKGFDDYCRQVYIPDGKSVEREEAEYAYPPTLSELIESCGDGFGKLVKGRGEYNNQWHIYSEENFGYDMWFKTPEEAVAKLWLALNKKDGTEE